MSAAIRQLDHDSNKTCNVWKIGILGGHSRTSRAGCKGYLRRSSKRLYNGMNPAHIRIQYSWMLKVKGKLDWSAYWGIP